MLVKYCTQPLPEGFEDIADNVSKVHFTRPSANIVALVVANSKSKTIETIDGGYMLQTTVCNHPSPETVNGEEPARYVLRSYCTLDNVKDFKMDPPRGSKQQVALVQIVAIASSDESTNAAEEMVVDSVQLLNDDQATQLQDSFQKLIYYSTLVSQQPSKEKRVELWTDTDESMTPMKAKKCRVLGKSPTNDELPGYRHLRLED